jgi:hypothetical protein
LALVVCVLQLNILGTIDEPTSGTVEIFGQKVESTSKDSYLADLRLRKIGEWRVCGARRLRLPHADWTHALPRRLCVPDLQPVGDHVCV